MGGVLLLINIFGLFQNLRNNDIYFEKTYLDNNIKINKKDLYLIINSNTSNEQEYITNLTDAVHKGIAHYWLDEIAKYNLTIPIYENYILYLMSYFDPQYKKYEFVNYNKALERGVGLCSQYSFVITEILKEKGFDSRFVALTRHRVSTVRLSNGKWWVIDPNYNVVLPYSLKEIESNPKIVKQFYKNKGFSDTISSSMIDIYEKKGNRVYNKNGGKWYYTKSKIEYWLYVLKWLIPFILFMPYLCYKFISRKVTNL
jgi:hypothetical protein